MREKSSIFHHTLKANSHHPNEPWGHLLHSLSTNSLGFKDRAVRDVPLKSSQYRILFIGDSFTEGVGYEYEKTFVGKIDEELKGYNIESLNAGVVTYSPTIYFKKIEYLIETVGLDFDHLVVFLDISDILDEAETYRIQDGRVVSLEEKRKMSDIEYFIFQYTGLVKNLWLLVRNIQDMLNSVQHPNDLRTAEDLEYAVNIPRDLWTIKEKYLTEFGRAGLKKASRFMDQLYDLTQKHHITMALAVYPWPTQIMHEDLDSIQVRFWQEWAGRHSVLFMNFFPEFIEPGMDPRRVIKTYFIKGDTHWNEKGHQLMAEGFLEKFRKAFPSLLTTK